MIKGKHDCVMMAAVMAVVGLACAQTAAAQGENESGKTPKVEPALGGYCPSSYLIDRKATKGDAKYQTKFRARVYFHASEERKAAFEKDPDKYLPRLDGLCTVALGGSYGNKIPGDPQVFNIEDGKVYLFSSTRAWRAYTTDPPRYRMGAEDLFYRPTLRGYCPVTYHEPGRAVKGEERFTAVYDRKVFRFSDGLALRRFNENPDKYMPAYDGYCAGLLAKKRLAQGNPEIFVVQGGRSYFFVTEEAKKEFQADPKKFIERGDAFWSTLE